MGKVRGWTTMVLAVIVLGIASWGLVSCGGGGGTSGGGGKQLTATQQAAASSSAAQGAIALSADVAWVSGIASGYIPPSYAPGKSGLKAGNEAIANIDPRLKVAVDKMLMQLQRPAVKNALAGPGTFNGCPEFPVELYEA